MKIADAGSAASQLTQMHGLLASKGATPDFRFDEVQLSSRGGLGWGCGPGHHGKQRVGTAGSGAAVEQLDGLPAGG
ncbi:hypothetical protein GCM10022409_31640 [Hymenobacter glaciei]|uniref:Uncharacterized protein n=1 Tax=Hymenobacter glaciei TaxID=877209 RepID=A0ABP7UH57_9BACT